MRKQKTNARRHPDRREEILQVATRLFNEHGVHSVTTRQIAAVIGISQPSLYAHFSSIQDIQEEVSGRAFSLLENSIRAASSGNTDPQDLLKQGIQSYIGFGLNNPDAYRIAFMIEHPDQNDSEKMGSEDFNQLDHPGPRAFSYLKFLVAGVRPDLDAETVECLGQSLWATLHGLVSLLIARRDFPWANRERLIAQHTQLAFVMVLNAKL
jgi:AcrR family transcriptional regulator